MQTAITKIFNNTVNTKYGTKTKYDVYVNTDQGEFKFQAWQGQWNQDWTMGSMIDMPESTDSRWQKQDYQGKTYFTLKAPPEASQGYGGQSTPQPQTTPQQAPVAQLDPSNAFGSRMTQLEQEFVILKKDVEKLQTEMADFKFQKMEQEIAKDNDDIPVIKTEDGDIPLNEVPF